MGRKRAGERKHVFLHVAAGRKDAMKILYINDDEQNLYPAEKILSRALTDAIGLFSSLSCQRSGRVPQDFLKIFLDIEDHTMEGSLS